MTETRTNVGYGDAAQALAVRYENIDFETLHADVLHLFPKAPADVLDIGAGSGRDAAAFARRGHRVTAVEPTQALRREGERIHRDVPIEWLDDALPGLDVVRATGRRFDLIMLTAVWMHLDLAQRRAGMDALVALLAPRGLVVMSLRHGPVPAGRRMFDVSADETLALGAEVGLVERYRSTRKDAQLRHDVTWSVVAMAMSAANSEHDGLPNLPRSAD
jgi:SAM-dependent methyltransferase